MFFKPRKERQIIQTKIKYNTEFNWNTLNNCEEGFSISNGTFSDIAEAPLTPLMTVLPCFLHVHPKPPHYTVDQAYQFVITPCWPFPVYGGIVDDPCRETPKPSEHFIDPTIQHDGKDYVKFSDPVADKINIIVNKIFYPKPNKNIIPVIKA